MRCCTRLALCLLAGWLGAPAWALEGVKNPPPVTLAEIEEFGVKGIPDGEWPALLEVLGSEGNGGAVRQLIGKQTPFPAAKLVEALVHPKLSVRLGALDLLEDAAGETFGFDPWSEEPAGGANAGALEKFRAWSANGAAPATAASTLNADSFRTLAMEIVSGERDRAERAMQRLEGFGLGAIGLIEGLLKDQPSLEEGARASLKAAVYRVLLRTALPRQAAALSRQLALGGPDAQATALPLLAEGGLAVLPIAADFLSSPDPLVRETAVDAAFKAGGERAVELALPLLATEKAESVLHSLLRNLGEQATKPAHSAAIARFLDHPSENVAISAADALARNKPGDVTQALAARFKDGRWRVRAAALEAVGKRALTGLAGQVEKMMDDPDQFVRVTAAQTYHTLLEDRAEAVLLARFDRQNELRAPILQAMLEGRNPPPDALWASLAKAPPATIVECLDALEDRSDHEGKRIVYASRFAAHPNADVRAAALRLLATYAQETGELLKALQSPDAPLRDAVLDQLHLPQGFLQSAFVAPPAAGAGKDSALDRLYSLLAGPGAAAASQPSAGPSADPKEFRKVLEGFYRDGSPRQKFRAALLLGSQGDSAAVEFLLAALPTLSPLDRRGVASAFGGPGEWPAGPVPALMTRLLADPADDVRETTIECWMRNPTPARLAGLLGELRRPGSLLKPDDLYGWEMSRALGQRASQPAILEWSDAVLKDAAASSTNKVFAIILLGATGQAAAAKLEPLLGSENQWLRRAAYRALGLGGVEAHLSDLLHNDAAMVRAVLPFVASPHSNGWLHWFDDAHSTEGLEDDNSTQRFSSHRPFGAWAGKETASAPGAAAPSPAVLAALEQLTRDPSDVVRFESIFALLRLGRPADPQALAALVPAQSEEANAGYRLGQFLNDHYTTLDKSYGVLVPLAKSLNEQNRDKIFKHFAIDLATAPVRMADLVRAVAAPVAAVPSAPPPAPLAKAAGPFRVVFFHKVGCHDCERVRQMLGEQSQRFPQVIIEERDLAEGSSALFNETLSTRFRVPDKLHQVTPAVFTQAGPLLRDEITFPKLGDLLRQAASLEPDAGWLSVRTGDLQTAQQTIVQRYDALALSVVLGSGLLDGINPCAMATIIFLLSYMQVARRAPQEILAVGSAFVASVFATYFVIGLGLAEVLARIAAVRLAGTLLNYALAAFALLLAVLSFRDAALAAQGNAGEMALQLPAGLKSRIRGVIRSGARTPRFVLAALVAGVLVSLLELACTGQVYLPTIQYMLKNGRAGAVWPLFLYNVAFILPLILVFILAWAGLRTETLVRLQQRHTALVKVLTGLLFLALTLLLLFAYRPVAP